MDSLMLIGGAFTTRGVHTLWPKRLAKLLAEDAGTLPVASTVEMLDTHFKSA